MVVYYYNPNIAPRSEYDRRLDELDRYARSEAFPLVVGEYDAREWTRAVRGLRHQGERSARCGACFRFRLAGVFRYARENGFAAVATVLSVSPHKDAALFNEVGRSLAAESGIGFIEADFKKHDGFRRATALSRERGFYRQNYCGCIYSKLERDRSSTWFRKYCADRGATRIVPR